MRPLLELLSDGAEHSIRDAYVQLADHFRLSEVDRQELIPSGTQQLLHNRVGWAKTYLLKAGLLQSPRRAVVQITDRGRQALASGQQIDNRFLRQFPEFIEFVTASQQAEPGDPPQQVQAPPTSEKDARGADRDRLPTSAERPGVGPPRTGQGRVTPILRALGRATARGDGVWRFRRRGREGARKARR
jgi:restriction system protein